MRLDQATGADALARLVTHDGGKVDRGTDPIALHEGGEEPDRDRRRARRAPRATAPRSRASSPGSTARRRAASSPRSTLVEALESFRRDTGLLKDVSFPTIAGAGPNGAIVHYRVTSRRPTAASRPASFS